MRLVGYKDKKRLKADLDEVWSYYVKMRDGLRCRFCDSPKRFNLYLNKQGLWRIPSGLQAAHIIARANWRYRWDVDNGIALCVGHHRLFDRQWRDTGRSDDEIVRRGILISEKLNEMKFAARQPAKIDLKLQMMFMKQLWDELSRVDDDCATIYEQFVARGIFVC